MEDNRRICYNTYRGSLMVAQSFGGKIKDISIEEFMPFEWDIKNNKNNKDNNKNTKTQPQYSTRKEFDEMKEMMNEFNKQ